RRGATGGEDAVALARVRGDGFGDAARRNQPCDPERCQCPVPVGTATVALPVELLARIRPSALLSPTGVLGRGRARRSGDGMADPVARPQARFLGVLRGTLRRVHVLSRRTGASAARSAVPNSFL